MARPAEGYRLDGKRVPGTTTIAGVVKESGGLIHWAWKLGMDGIDYRSVRDSAADAGTLAHAMVEASLSKNDPEAALSGAEDGVADAARRAFKSYQQWARGSALEVLAQEVSLVSREYRYGGTLDAVGWVNGELCLLDWKSSNALYADYLLQIAAYKHLWDENNPKDVIGGGFHLCRFSKEYGDFEHRFFEDLADAWEAFKHAREIYDLMNKLKKRVR